MNRMILADIECAAFDFDGVILDSSGLKTDSFRMLYQQYDDIFDEAMEYHYTNKGMSRFMQFDYVTKNLMTIADPETKAIEMAKEYSNIVFDLVSNAPFIDGAVDFLEYLFPRIPLYIISSGPHNELETIMESRNLKKYFSEYWGSVDTKEEYLKKIMSLEKLNPQRVLYVGDTFKDLAAAEKAGAIFCGIQNKFTDFSDYNCLQVKDLFGLKKMFVDSAEE